QEPLAVELAENLDQFRDGAGPTCLVTGSQACPVISMEVLVKKEVIFPLRIGLEHLSAAVNRASARLAPQEDPDQPTGDLSRYLKQVHLVTRAGRALDFEIVAII